MFEPLEDRRLFSLFTIVTPTVLAPPPPPPPVTGLGAVVNLPIGAVLGPITDPNLSTPNANRIVGDTLYVTGSSASESIDISFKPTTLVISARTATTAGSAGSAVKSAARSAAFSVTGIGSVISPVAGDTYVIKRGSILSDSVPAAGIKKIVVATFDGSDFIYVQSSLHVPTVLLAGAGDDYVIGGPGNDYIEGGLGNDKLSGKEGNDTLICGVGDDTATGDAGDDVLRGDAGNDKLDGGAGSDTLYGADGDDSLFSGLGNDTLYGGNGDDTLVSVFGGFDKVSGDQGWDIFVADKADYLTDMDNLATTRQSIYRIDKFANPTKPGVFATELGFVDIADPAKTSRASSYGHFDYLPVFTNKGPKMEDVQQNQLDDCWLASTAASVARATPWVIKRTIIPLGDGTVMAALGGKVYRMDCDLPVNSQGNAAYGSTAGRNGDSLWFPLLEKGMAYHMKSGSNYSYGDVESDTPGVAYDALRVSYDRSTLVWFGTDEGQMWDKINSNTYKAMTITTEPGILGVDGSLRPSHAYSIIGTFKQGYGQKMVILRNPSDLNGQDAGNGGIVTISASDLYSSCLLLYISK